MVALRAKFDQFHKVGCGLGARIALPDSGERILQNDFSQSMQTRFARARDLDFSFVKKIELPGKAALRAARPFGHGLDATE